MIESRTNEDWWGDAEKDPVHLAAVEWFARLQDPEVSLEDTLSWQEWMTADVRHAQAFSRIEDVSAAARGARSIRKLSARELASDRYDGSLPLSEWRRPPRSKLAFAIAASVALMTVGMLGWLVGSGRSGLEGSGTILTTAVGENRTVSLEDGSRITLGGSTQVEVALSKSVRSIELVRGEAFFVVAHDQTRPFKVHAGDATVTAVGTEFNVRRDSDRAVVAVTEGRVIVEPVTGLIPVALLRELKPKLRAVHVDAGEQTTAGSAGIEDASKVEDPSATTSWQTGRLAFRLQPLKYVLEDVNRYAPKPIVLEDESIGSLVITGTVTGGNVDGWIASLERAFALAAREEPDRIVIRRADQD